MERLFGGLVPRHLGLRERVLGDGGPRHQATLKALLDAGASTTLTDRHGNTPLHLARQRSYTAMVQMLEASGARP